MDGAVRERKHSCPGPTVTGEDFLGASAGAMVPLGAGRVRGSPAGPRTSGGQMGDPCHAFPLYLWTWLIMS